MLASNFRASSTDVDQTERLYSRNDGTAGWEALESVVGELEGGEAVAFGSGMAAAAAVLEQLPVGSRVVAPTDCYTAVGGLLTQGQEIGRWSVERVDISDTPAAIAAAGSADLFWLESPTNPLMQVADVAAISAATRAAGGRVVVDNTFATPLLQHPLALGADVVVHSATKFMGGHSDLLLGLAVAADAREVEGLRRRRMLAGATPGALEAYLTLRGIRTMGVRLEKGQQTAGHLATRLAQHSAVSRVRYPGLPTDPGHELATQQMTGFGAVLAFEVQDAAAADAVCAAVEVVTSATSLGGVESTIERRAKLPGQEHVPDGLLRVSVGCEHVEDLWDDLATALDTAARDDA